MKPSALVLGLLVAVSSVQASEVSLGLNEHTIHTKFATPINHPFQFNGGYTYNEEEGHMMDLGIALQQRKGRHDFTVGTKYYRTWPDRDETANAVAIGGGFRSAFGDHFRFTLEGYYAPSVLAFDDLENMATFDTRLEWLPTANLNLGVGFKYSNLDYKHRSDFNFDDKLYVNMGFRF